MGKKKSLTPALLTATTSMVQGGLSETWRRCGKSTCQCQRDPSYRHGPHLYLTYREDGESRSLYVPPEQAAFWETGCAIAARNRAHLRQQWQRAGPGRARRARRRSGR